MNNRLPFRDLLRDLPPSLQQAVHEAVTECQPIYTPRPYAHDWQEELYHEAAYAALQALCTYNPRKGSLYRWGKRVIKQHLQKFCDKVWVVTRSEISYPCDEETGDEVEFIDEAAEDAYEIVGLELDVQRVWKQLSKTEHRVWALMAKYRSYRQVAVRMGWSHEKVRRYWNKLKAKIRALLAAESNSEGGESA